VHTLICCSSGLPLLFLFSPVNSHDGPFAQRLLAWAMSLYLVHPRVVRLDAAYWGLHLIVWIHTVLGAVAVVAFNPKNRSCLPPTWTGEELGKRSAIERFGCLAFFSFFISNALPCVVGPRSRDLVALTYAASVIVGLAAQQAGRPDLIRSLKRVFAHPS
jgi:hypothetical protein